MSGLKRFSMRRFTMFGLVTLLVFLTLATLLASSVSGRNSAPTSAPTNGEAVSPQAAAAEFFVCQPIQAATFTNRVHVRCSAAAPGGIFWFAVSTNDQASASRFLSIFSSALVTGRSIAIFYNPSDLSGNAWGCLQSDCRIATGAGIN